MVVLRNFAEICRVLVVLRAEVYVTEVSAFGSTEARASGAGETEIWTARAEAFGPEAADRLARLDAERAKWDRRVADYRQGLERIESAEAGTAEKRAAATTLLSMSFSPLEQKRLRALERLGR